MSDETTPDGTPTAQRHSLPGLRSSEHELDSLAESLAERFPAVDAEQVRSIVREAHAALTAGGGFRLNVIALTEHAARERILTLHTTEPR